MLIMCGIAGVISLNNNTDLDVIKSMASTITHRGPDGEGYLMGDNFAFAHKRLSVIDLSNAGHQPMEYLERYVITYNGEVYNHIELREMLKEVGYEFASHTDTEVILAAYDQWGPDCVNRFNGMWAFVIFDRLKNTVFLSRDRFGIKPLYYYYDGEVFVFGSEIKTLLKHPSIKSTPDKNFLVNYLKEGPKEYLVETAIEKVYKFPAASYIEAEVGELVCAVVPKVFWTLKPNLKKERFSQEKANVLAQKYYEMLFDAVRLRLRADVKVGSALSGGLDSSSIVYLVNQQLKSKGKKDLQETFSTVYKSSGTENCDESVYIDMLAKEFGVSSNQIEPTIESVAKEYENVIWHMENPPEGSLMSSWHTFKKVAQTDVTVTLDGQGADEQLAGYLGYINVYLTSISLFDFYKELPYFFKIPKAKKHIFVAFFMNHFRFVFGNKLLLLLVKKLTGRNFKLNLNEVLVDDINTSLNTLLHYADHTSMAHGIESRMPFMDYRLVEFLAEVPACYKMRNGWTKYLARLAFNNKLPDEICWRKDKMGWPIPEEYWFRGELKEWYVKKTNSSNLIKELEPGFSASKKITSNTKISKVLNYLNLALFEKLFVLR